MVSMISNIKFDKTTYRRPDSLIPFYICCQLTFQSHEWLVMLAHVLHYKCMRKQYIRRLQNNKKDF